MTEKSTKITFGGLLIYIANNLLR